MKQVYQTRSSHCLRILAVVAFLLSVGCDSSGNNDKKRAPVDETQSVLPKPEISLTDGLDSFLPTDSASPRHYTGIEFTNVAEDLGLKFVFKNGASEERLMPSATSGGCAWADFDHDGWVDVILPQGGRLGSAEPDAEAVDHVFRNIRGKQFQNCTGVVGLQDVGYSHGVAIGDFDNDGFNDVYIANVGPDVLHRNLGDGTFEVLSLAAGIDNLRWASSVAFGDLNNDGNLDIYVCNYVDYDPLRPTACLSESGMPATCHPKNVGESPNCCFMNNGDLTFTESAESHGLLAPGSKSLGVVIADLDSDHDVDIYVANDTEGNHLFLNNGLGSFTENAVGLGVSASGLGHLQASMGIAFGDFDRNGAPDIYVTHFIDDSNTMYSNLGNGVFTDATRDSGLHQVTLPYLAFGTVMADFDSDGWQDLFVTNGHIDDWRERTGAAWEMPGQVFRYADSQWHDVSADSGAYFKEEWLGRGVAFADYDLDGDLDIAVVHQNANTGLLRNDAAQGNWLQFQLVGNQSNRNGMGVSITVEQAGVEWVQQLAGGASFCSSSEPIVTVGLGASEIPANVSVRWPSGVEFQAKDIKLNKRYILSERSGLLQ